MASRTWHLTTFLVGLLAWALTGQPCTSAATLTVTDLGDTGAPGQLRTLINAAAPGDTILIPAGTITLKGPAGEDANAGGDLDLTKTLTIQGAGTGTTVINGGGIDRVFHIDPFSAGISVTISEMTITGGNPGSNHSGGGILNNNTAILSLTNVTVSGNTAATAFGGGILNAGTATLTHVTIAGNTGGGIRNVGPATLTNVTISGNTSSGFAGGIINIGSAATLSLTDVTVSGNTATLDGGGILNNGGTLTLTRVTIAANTTGGDGGGLAHGAGTASLTNVTVSGNSAHSGGGGIFNLSSTLTLTNVTLNSNTADFGADGILGGGSVQLKNTLIANNRCSGTITSLGHNLDSGNTCGFTGPGDLTNTDPKLGPLASNGGPTQTHALLPGSPAIDAGTNTGCPATDQRGVARPQDGNLDGSPTCDIGAYEAVPFNPAAVSAFVTRLYQTVLGRAPDPGGLAAFIAQIQAFGTVIPTVLAFFKSEEFLSHSLTDVQFLTVLYHTFLDREPDPDGLAAFLALLQTGCRTRDTLLAALSFSDEFRSLVPPVPVADPRIPFLAEVFAWTLNRPPDPAGFASFLAQLQRSTVLAVLTQFLHSFEFTTPRRSANDYVSALYLVFLGRPPDCPGLFSFVAALTPDTDAKRDQFAAQFAGSQEFQTILNRVFP